MTIVIAIMIIVTVLLSLLLSLRHQFIPELHPTESAFLFSSDRVRHAIVCKRPDSIYPPSPIDAPQVTFEELD